MPAQWLNRLLAFALLLAFPAAAQDGVGVGGLQFDGNGENRNYQLELRGGTTGGGTNSNDPALSSVTTLGGGETDTVIWGCFCTDTAAPATCDLSGPAGAALLVNQTAGNGRLKVYLVQGTNANKGTSITCTNPGSNSGGTTAAELAFRGADLLFLDATTTTSGPTTSTNPDPASITTVSDNAAVIAICASNISDTTPGDISGGYATAAPGKQTLNQADTNPGTIAMTWRNVAAMGTENPGAFSSWGSAAWACGTVALRPWR